MSFVELLRPITGRESWDHFDWHDLGITRRTLALAFADQLRPMLRRIKSWRTRRRWLRRHHAVLARLAASGGPKKILFVCYGNICRSPLAAALAQPGLSGIEIESAGFHEAVGRSSPEKILRIACSFGLDLAQHRSTRVSREQMLSADLLIAMDLENAQRIKAECPEALARTTLLGLFASPPAVDIADPYQADERTTGEICAQVRSGIEGLVRGLPSRTLSYQGKVSAAPSTQ
jgi:protein-tyrosine-phosphatase